METNEELKTWEEFIGSPFLKTDDVRDDEHPFVVVGVEKVTNQQNVGVVRLTFESMQKKYVFDLNKTNSVKVRDEGIKTPMDAMGKKFFFKKVLVNNPQTKKEVESLRVTRVE